MHSASNPPRCGWTRYSWVTAAALIAASSQSLKRGSGAIFMMGIVKGRRRRDCYLEQAPVQYNYGHFPTPRCMIGRRRTNCLRTWLETKVNEIPSSKVASELTDTLKQNPENL